MANGSQAVMHEEDKANEGEEKAPMTCQPPPDFISVDCRSSDGRLVPTMFAANEDANDYMLIRLFNFEDTGRIWTRGIPCWDRWDNLHLTLNIHLRWMDGWMDRNNFEEMENHHPVAGQGKTAQTSWHV